MATNQEFSTAAILGRWQPVHLGHQAALDSICEHFDHVIIGIGSSNIYDYRNPFHQDEVEAMLTYVLTDYDNYRLVQVPDMADDKAWSRKLTTDFGLPDVFYTANPYVKSLLQNIFPIAHPASIIPEARKTAVSATVVRRELARGGSWQDFLPPEVTEFISKRGLDDRFRADFGLQTLMMETIVVN